MKKRIFLILVIAFILDICSSESSSCDSEHSSVCSFLNGTKTCCPIKDGTCCSDVDFCCPKGDFIQIFKNKMKLSEIF